MKRQVLVLCVLLAACSKTQAPPDALTTNIASDVTSIPISTVNFNLCMQNNTIMVAALARSTKALDSNYAAKVQNATTEVQVRSILAERFTASDVNILVSAAKSCKTLTTNISNSPWDWNSKVQTYQDQGGGSLPEFMNTCEGNRTTGLTGCDHTEWFVMGCSILGGFLNPWLGAGLAIATKVAADKCRASVEGSYQLCLGNSR